MRLHNFYINIVGGCDKAGHPLVIFPTEYQSALTQTSEEDLLSLLHYFRKIVSDEQRRQGFTFLVNLQKSSTQFITKLVSALNSFQVCFFRFLLYVYLTKLYHISTLHSY